MAKTVEWRNIHTGVSKFVTEDSFADRCYRECPGVMERVTVTPKPRNASKPRKVVEPPAETGGAGEEPIEEGG